MKAKCYCPICKNKEFRDVDFDTFKQSHTKHILNIRDGFGSFLYHFPCSKCGSIMNATTREWFSEIYDTKPEKEKTLCDEYYEAVINMYGVDDYGKDFRKWAEDRWAKITGERN